MNREHQTGRHVWLVGTIGLRHASERRNFRSLRFDTGGTVITGQPLAGRQLCADCSRVSYERGPYYVIEAALDRNLTFQADEYLMELRGSKSKTKRRRIADLAVVFEEYAFEGELEVPLQLNQLRGEIWEFKTAADRLPFYECNDGSAKAIRMTHGFMKKTQKTPRREIDKAEAIAAIDRDQVSVPTQPDEKQESGEGA